MGKKEKFGDGRGRVYPLPLFLRKIFKAQELGLDLNAQSIDSKGWRS